MDDRTRRVLRHQQAALLSALGAFDALAIVGADKHLPGYARCKKEVEDALAEAKEMFSHCIAGALADIEEDAYVIHQLEKLLAEIAVIVNGPEPPMTQWSYHDLPEKVLALKDAAGRKAVGAVFEKLPQSQTPKSTGRFG